MELIKKRKKSYRLDITPLIDVVFLLLIFFMLTFSVPGQGIDIHLPGESAGVETPERPLTLTVNQDGSLRLEGQVLELDGIGRELKSKWVHGKDRSLVVDIHNQVPYDTFVRVLDLAKKAGAESFSIIR